MIHHHILGTDGITLTAAFVAGIAGSTHCVLMCGGVSGALGMRARQLGATAHGALAHAVSYQAGRVGNYALLGAAAGTFGHALNSLLDLVRLAFVLRIAAGLLVMAIALRILVGWRLLEGVERLGARLWRRIAPLALLTQTHGLAGSILLGAVWGWMPCGLIYSMLLFSTLAGTATQGALIMALFGLGTFPAMLGMGLLSGHLTRISMVRGAQRLAGAMLFIFGALTALAPLFSMHH